MMTLGTTSDTPTQARNRRYDTAVLTQFRDTPAAPCRGSSPQPRSTRWPFPRSPRRWTGPVVSTRTSPTARCAADSVDVLALWGDAEDRAAEAQRLKHLHRDVHGIGGNDFADVRYSALDPVLWNWIAVSGMFLILHSFTPRTGIVLSVDGGRRPRTNSSWMFRDSGCLVAPRDYRRPTPTPRATTTTWSRLARIRTRFWTIEWKGLEQAATANPSAAQAPRAGDDARCG